MKKKLLVALATVAVLALAGCQSTEQTNDALPTSTSVPNNETEPTLEPTTVPTSELAPTSTPAPTVTEVPTEAPTSTPTPDPTATPIPETDVSAFEWTTLEDDTISITKYVGSETDVVIPASIDGKAVTEVGMSAFEFNKDIMSVVIPDGVTKIGDCAFNFCINLNNVSLPSTLESIGGAAFTDCYDLKSIDMPSSVSSIAPWAFIDVTIYGDKGSYAEQWANEYYCTFKQRQ